MRPYFATAIYRLSEHASTACPLMAVDQYWRLYYNPDAVQLYGVEQLAGVMLHEVEHLLLRHHQRLHRYPMLVANLAGDMAINAMLRSEGVVLPSDAVYPETCGCPDGWAAEQYAEHLLSQGEQESGDGQGEGQGQGQSQQQGQEEGEGQGAPSRSAGEPTGQGSGADQSPESCETGESSSLGTHGNTPAEREQANAPLLPQWGGSCGHGYTQPWELPPDDPNAPPVSEAEAEVVRHIVAQAVRTRGNVPARYARWAEEQLAPPAVDWRRELHARIMRGVGKVQGAVDYTRARPSRRQSAYGRVVMPSLVQPVPSVGVVLDASGSISDGEIRAFLSEVDGILRHTAGQAEVWVAVVDAHVHALERVRDLKSLRPKIRGGGGTDLRYGFDALAKVRPAPPSVVVVLTDGETPWPPTKPAWAERVIIALTAVGATCPEWAEVIRI